MSALCLVTGGAGFIGSHLVEGLTVAGHRVRVLDDFSTGTRTNLEGCSPAPEIIAGDVGDATTVARAMQDVQVVYHLAALASVQRSVEAPGDTHQVCTTGTLHVLDAARRQGARRVVYAGSASAYGIPDNEVQSETDPVCPLSPYAAAKLAGELYARSFSAAFALETVCLRFFNIFGPRQRADSPYSGVIALFVAALGEGRAPTIFGDGQQTRDFTYVANVVDALMKAGSTDRKECLAGRIYNVGTGQRTNLLDLLTGLNRLLGTNIAAKHALPRTGDIRHSCANISRARQELGYEPTVNFEDGLEHTVRWYQGAGCPSEPEASATEIVRAGSVSDGTENRR
jgi:UDP-glucose 4-epimerase